jgi:hypothetical protein
MAARASATFQAFPCIQQGTQTQTNVFAGTPGFLALFAEAQEMSSGQGKQQQSDETSRLSSRERFLNTAFHVSLGKLWKKLWDLRSSKNIADLQKEDKAF